eukprot:jgi/Galph1/5011/GphlegSOOS_G3601.1
MATSERHFQSSPWSRTFSNQQSSPINSGGDKGKSFVVRPKDPFAPNWSKAETQQPSWGPPKRPRPYVSHQNKTSQLLLSRCSAEFCRRDVIRNYFQGIVPGRVVDVQVKPERGSAIVTFASEDDAEYALIAGKPQEEVKLRIRYFFPREGGRKDAPFSHAFSNSTFADDDDVDDNRMETEELPAFESGLQGDFEDRTQNSKPQEEVAKWTDDVEPKNVTSEDYYKRMQRDARFSQSFISDDEADVEHNDESSWRPAGDKLELSAAHNLVGTCLEMCPVEERYRREAQRDLSVFEIDYSVVQPPGEPPKVDHSKALKKYVRSAACQEAPKASEIRTPAILERTMEYIIDSIVDREDFPFWEVHNFVRDRTRSIRQDFTFQGIRNEVTISIIEKTVRFHILSEQKLCEEDPSVYSSRQNMEQLDKCLISLREMYREMRTKGFKTSDDEAEFQAYYILSHVDPHSVLAVCRELDYEVLRSEQVRFALKVYQTLRQTNYIQFFRLLKSATYLVACMMQKHFLFIRKSALLIMQKCYSRFPEFPVEELERMLLFEDKEDAISFCESLGYSIEAMEDGIQVIRLDKRQSGDLSKYHSRRGLKYIESKSKDFSIRSIMLGETEWHSQDKSFHLKERERISTPENISEATSDIRTNGKQEKQIFTENEPVGSPKKRSLKLSANAPEFVPSKPMIENVSLIPQRTIPQNTPETFNKMPTENKVNSQPSALATCSSLRGNPATIVLDSKSQDGFKVPKAPAVSFSKESFFSLSSVENKNPASTLSALSPQSFDETTTKSVFHFEEQCRDKVQLSTKVLKRKDFSSEENADDDLLDRNCTDGKKSRVTEETLEVKAETDKFSQQEHETVDEIEEEKNKVEEELILNTIEEGKALAKYDEDLHALHEKTRRLLTINISYVELLENLKKSSLLLSEKKQALEKYVEETESLSLEPMRGEVIKYLKLVKSLVVEYDAFIHELNTKCKHIEYELERRSVAAESLMKAPSEAVMKQRKDMKEQVENRELVAAFHSLFLKQKTRNFVSSKYLTKSNENNYDNSLSSTIYMLTVRSLANISGEWTISAVSNVLLSTDSTSSNDYMASIFQRKVELIDIESNEISEILERPFIVILGIDYCTDSYLQHLHDQLKSFITSKFTFAITLVVVVQSFQRDANAFIQLEERIADNLSILLNSGYLTSFFVVCMDFTHWKLRVDMLLRKLKIAFDDADRTNAISRYICHPSTSGGMYTVLEVALHCVQVALDQMFHCQRSFVVLCIENWKWFLSKLNALREVFLPGDSRHVTIVSVAQTLEQLCNESKLSSLAVFGHYTANENQILLISENPNAWWQEMERVLSSLLGSVSHIALPVHFGRLLYERRVQVLRTLDKEPKTNGRNVSNDLPFFPHNVSPFTSFAKYQKSDSNVSPVRKASSWRRWLEIGRQQLAELEGKLRYVCLYIYCSFNGCCCTRNAAGGEEDRAILTALAKEM